MEAADLISFAAGPPFNLLHTLKLKRSIVITNNAKIYQNEIDPDICLIIVDNYVEDTAGEYTNYEEYPIYHLESMFVS